MALNTSNGSDSGIQVNTQSPQTSAAPSGQAAKQSANVQPGTATDLLRNTSGIQLQDTPVTTVSLGAPAQQAAASAAPKHHVHPGLLLVALLLFAVAVGLFWSTRSVNKTTY